MSISNMSYNLTKSKITTGLHCPKKLWFDINDKIKIDHFNLHRGNVFGEKIKEIYGNGFDKLKSSECNFQIFGNSLSTGTSKGFC